MWILSNGKITRVQVPKDPMWSVRDIWSFNNMYAKLINLGYNNEDAQSYSTAYVLKKKWPQTLYHESLEKILLVISS